jgi:hypothetical protein
MVFILKRGLRREEGLVFMLKTGEEGLVFVP